MEGYTPAGGYTGEGGGYRIAGGAWVSGKPKTILGGMGGLTPINSIRAAENPRKFREAGP
jgi:hypothetical protein